MDSERPAEPGSTAPHFVVWHAPGVPPPADLMAALEKRHASIEFCSSPFAALAAVCEIDRAGRVGMVHAAAPNGHAPNGHATNGHGPHTGHGVVLVLVRIEALADVGTVVRAVELYAPRARCWRYESGTGIRLKAVSGVEFAPESPPPEVAPAVVVMPAFQRGPAKPTAPVPGAVRHPRQSRPQLRLAGDGVLPARPEESEDSPPAGKVREAEIDAQPAPDAPGMRQVLSAEELSMLLGEDTLEHKDQSPPKRAGDST